MEVRTQMRHWFPIIAAVLLVACEIDQGGSPTPDVQTASVTYGPIDGFGSVILNGETIPTGTAAILVNGFPGVETELNVGQVVRVLSLTTNGVREAVLVEYQSNVIGPVEAIDATAGTLTVLGQTINVAVDADLNIPGVTVLDDIVVGTVIEVSALGQNNGDLLATYLGGPSLFNLFSLGTTVSAVDLNAMQFTLGGITVDYSQANILELTGGQPAVGQIVVAIGIAFGANGELIADQVIELNVAPGLFSQEATSLMTLGVAPINTNALSGFDANFVGFIVTTDNATTITINDVTVNLDATTNIVGGMASDLNVGTLVQIRGEVSDLGDIRAVEITIL